MNKKGQLGLSAILLVFITIIVGVILFQTIAQNVGSMTNTIEVANESLTTVVNGTPQYLTNYRALSSVVIYNETGDVIVGSGNYTIANNVVYNGALAVEITPDATAIWKSAWQISGTAQPLTYVPDSGGRAMVSLIVIFFALAIAAASLYPVMNNKILGN